ncbi:MAG TPA: endonuclease III [Armatimonadetes bacterium]|nr:endonuclease III [Armatimonadota bacterium]
MLSPLLFPESVTGKLQPFDSLLKLWRKGIYCREESVRERRIGKGKRRLSEGGFNLALCLRGKRGVANVTRSEIRWVAARLAEQYGDRRWQPQEQDPLDSLVQTLLSQNNTAQNTRRAFAQLKERFPTWEEVRQAEVAEVTAAIYSAGLARVKAQRIKDLLDQIYAERGETSLNYLQTLPTEEVKAHLRRFKGVGPKTASCVLLFSLGRPDFPVDTHVWRIVRRLGWVPEALSREETYELLNPLVPEDLKYSLHLNLISHGRTCCRARNPRCDKCPLSEKCAYYHRLSETVT